MKFELSTDNIRDAITASVKEQVNLKEGQEIEITFTNGRGPKGVSATVEIVAAGSKKAEVATAAPTATTAQATTSEAAAAAPVERLNGKVVASAAEPAVEPQAADPAPQGGEAKAGLFNTL